LEPAIGYIGRCLIRQKLGDSHSIDGSEKSSGTQVDNHPRLKSHRQPRTVLVERPLERKRDARERYTVVIGQISGVKGLPMLGEIGRRRVRPTPHKA
jgi:hypothetical protein